MTRDADVSMILTLHTEGRLLLPTAHALGEAIREARRGGLAVELVVVFDRADPQTRRAWRGLDVAADLALDLAPVIVDTAHGDLGLARMSGIHASTGQYVGVLDADNLPTRNWIAEAVRLLRARSDAAVAHPALIHTFDAKREIWPLRSSEAEGFRPGTLAWFNPWDAFVIAHREVFERYAYRRLAPGEGFGPEDWAWNCDTVAGGVPHIIVPGTTLFYQKKHHSSLAMAHSNSLLPRNALLTSKEIAAAETKRLAATLSERTPGPPSTAKAFVRRLRRWRTVDHAVRAVRYATRAVHARAARRKPAEIHPHLRDTALRANWARAHHLQPRIPYPSDDVAREYGIWGDDWDNDFVPDRLAYWSAIAALPEAPDMIFFAPWIGTGGADLLVSQYVNAVHRLRPDASIVVITTEPRASTRLDLLDEGVEVFDLGAFGLHHEFAVRVIAMVLTQLRPSVVHIVNSTAAYDAVDRFGVAIAAHSAIFLSTYVVENFPDGTQWSFAFHRSRDFFDRVACLLTDNTGLAQQVIAREGVPASKVLVHHQVVDEEFVPRGSSGLEQGQPVRLAWAGRFDRQKRLDRLAALVEALAAERVAFSLDVYGEPVLADDPDVAAHLARLRAVGARIHPAFTRGFSSIDPASVDALVITSEREGIPNVMLEAMSSGVPVIAAAVGDIPLLIDDRTGYLVEDPAEVPQYVAAVRSLIGDPSDAIRRVRAARELVEREYSQENLERTLSEIPGYLPPVGGTASGGHRPWRWYAEDRTRDLLAEGNTTVLIYTGSNGHSNFGDILQTKNIVRYWRDRPEVTPVLFLPAFAATPEGRHADLSRWLGVEHIVYFSDGLSDPPQALLPAMPSKPTKSLLHVVGGGYLNEFWGTQHFAAIDAIVTGYDVSSIVFSGLQLDMTAVPELEALANRRPIVYVGVRDESSLQILSGSSLPAEYTFDDLIEVLDGWAVENPPPRSDAGCVVIHMNTSEYAGGETAREMWIGVLKQIANTRPPEVVILSAYADKRADVRDALRTVADMAEAFPFTEFRVVDIAKIALTSRLDAHTPAELAALRTARFAVSSSYHTALLMTALGVPAYLMGANAYFAQKAGLFALPSFDRFLENPSAHLLDLSAGRFARRSWTAKLDRLP